MLAVPLCGERVLMRLESIGIETLDDLDGRDPWELMHEINRQAGRVIWRPPLAVQALQNLVDAAARGLVASRGGDMASGAASE